MKFINETTQSGIVDREPEQKSYGKDGGQKITVLTLKQEEKSKDGSVKASYIQASCFGDTARIAMSARVGQQVLLHGKITGNLARDGRIFNGVMADFVSLSSSQSSTNQVPNAYQASPRQTNPPRPTEPLFDPTQLDQIPF